jgi:hypothetical protein
MAYATPRCLPALLEEDETLAPKTSMYVNQGSAMDEQQGGKELNQNQHRYYWSMRNC